VFLQQMQRGNVMQLFLQPITEQYCECTTPKCARGRNFASALGILRVGKGRELRGLLISFAT
jgi:hypothetical protein